MNNSFLAIVEPQVFRTSTAISSAAIVSLNIKTILILSAEISKQFTLHLQEEGKKIIHLETQRNLGWRPVSDEMIKEGLLAILDTDNHPIVIMCSTGVFETGVLVGCLRKLQGWDFNAILVEYRSFAASKSKYAVDQFIELFDTDLVVLPANLPKWFSKYLQMVEENRLKLLR